MAKYEEPVSYFDMDLKGVYKLNKTAHLRLNQYIKKLEKQQNRSVVKMDHDIRETKRNIAKIEEEKNKLVMKLLKSYVNKTAKKKGRVSRIPGSTGQTGTGFTFSTYHDSSRQTSQYLPHVQRPLSIQIPARQDQLSRGIPDGKAMSDFGFPFGKFKSTDESSQGTQTGISKLKDIKRKDVFSRSSLHTRPSHRLEMQSRTSNKRDVFSRASKVSDLPATRGQLAGQEHSIEHHVQKVKECLGGNTCLYRGHPPAKGYNIPVDTNTPRPEKNILPSDIEANIEPDKLLERIKIFGNVKIPSKHNRHKADSQIKLDDNGRRIPTLPSILSVMTENIGSSKITINLKQKYTQDTPPKISAT